MNEQGKNARKKLKAATRSEYLKLTYDAALTPEQQQILDLHILRGKSIFQISIEMNMSERTITQKLFATYKKIKL